jgi:branched-chain amino acid aminotransferase
MAEQTLCWMNGELLPVSAAKISVLDHGLLYGDGVFEGVRFYNRQPFKLEEHLQRLERSARAIALALPVTREELRHAAKELIMAFHTAEGYLRIVLTRGEGAMGLDPRGCRHPNLFIIADQLQLVSEEVRQQGIRLVIASIRRLPLDGLDPRIKSLNYLNHILARIEANNANADEAILLNQQGRVAEGSAENIFIVRNGNLVTPPVTEGALEGITRQTVIDLANRAAIPAKEAPLAPYDLYTADECFLTGSGAELIPVREVDGRRMTDCPGEVYSSLLAMFKKVVRVQAHTD